MNRRTWGVIAFVGAIIVVSSLVFGLVPQTKKKGGASETTTTTTTSTTVPAGGNSDCPTWAVKELDNGGHRIVAQGIEAINTATTPEQAREAAVVHLETVKTDPEALAATVKQYLKQDVDPSALHEQGCMTVKADQLVLEVGIVMGQAMIVPEDAPAMGTNSGADANGAIVSAEAPGINGNRKAIKIVLKDGSVFWIMARCGNFVTIGQAFPPGPTDQPPIVVVNPPDTKPTTAPPEVCPPPVGVPPELWNYVLCKKKNQSRSAKQQGGVQAGQAVGDQSTTGTYTGSEPGVVREDPPPAEERPQGSPDGGSGDGGAGPAVGPVDNTHQDDETTVESQPECPFGPGNC